MFTTPLIVWFLLLYCPLFCFVFRTIGQVGGFPYLEKHGAFFGMGLGIVLSVVSHILVLAIAKRIDKTKKKMTNEKQSKTELPAEIKERIDLFTDKLNALEWNDLCRLAMLAVKKVLPTWNAEVKRTNFVYPDHVCGVRHSIPKNTVDIYIEYLEKNPHVWGTDKTRNTDILELWVALTDFDVELSPKASQILSATYCLMSNSANRDTRNQFIETFAHLSQVFDGWDRYENFINEVWAEL